MLLTNFRTYVNRFAEKFGCQVYGADRPMQAATNADGLTIINFGIGSPNAATVMDLLTACHPKAVLFLGKCGGLKHSTDIGHFILPIGAIRGEGTSATTTCRRWCRRCRRSSCTSSCREKLVDRNLDYRTGVVYTTNRRVWEHDEEFKTQLAEYTPIAIDMETATIFVVGHKNQIARGALLLVSDLPMTPEGVKTSRERREGEPGLVRRAPGDRHRVAHARSTTRASRSSTFSTEAARRRRRPAMTA